MKKHKISTIQLDTRLIGSFIEGINSEGEKREGLVLGYFESKGRDCYLVSTFNGYGWNLQEEEANEGLAFVEDDGTIFIDPKHLREALPKGEKLEELRFWWICSDDYSHIIVRHNNPIFLIEEQIKQEIFSNSLESTDSKATKSAER